MKPCSVEETTFALARNGNAGAPYFPKQLRVPSRKKRSNAGGKTACLLLMAIGGIIGTGAYVVYPLAMYVLLGSILFVYGHSLLKRAYRINMQSNVVLLLYVAFLLINFLRDYENEVAGRLYVNFFLGICTYLVVTKVLSLQRDVTKFRYLPLISLIGISLGLVLELNGLISFGGEDDGDGGSVSEGLLLRPGGFLNPNMSAALSLIWVFVALESKALKSNWMKFACVAICFFIAFVTQSRASLLSLSLYFAWKVYEGGTERMKYYLIAVAGGLLVLMFSGNADLLQDIYKANVERAHGDSSSDERYFVLQSALSIFSNYPLAGRGMRAMYHYVGLGTHNEIIEWLVNFGMIGFAVMLLVFFRFYFTWSFKYVALCILPTFIFSHNFFETTAFQVALAFAFYLNQHAALTGREKHAALDTGSRMPEKRSWMLRFLKAKRGRQTAQS